MKYSGRLVGNVKRPGDIGLLFINCSYIGFQIQSQKHYMSIWAICAIYITLHTEILVIILSVLHIVLWYLIEILLINAVLEGLLILF